VFGRVALPAFVIVVVTGTVSALIELGAPAALWQTAYGRVLAAKVALVALIAAASYVHALRLRSRLLAGAAADGELTQRRHWRLLSAQARLGGVVLAAAAAFGLAYLLFAFSGPGIALLAVAFGMLATVQAVGNVAASAIAGLLYTLTSPTVAFSYLAAWMLIALAALVSATSHRQRSSSATDASS